MKTLFIIICFGFLVACTPQEDVEEPNPGIEEPDIEEPIDQETHTFTAEIISIHENGASGVVLSEDIAGYPSGAEISVSLTEEEEWEVGDQVRVEHEGPFLESHPIQIQQVDIEKIE
jgi:hypothetical protein